MLNKVTMKTNNEPNKLFEQLGEIQNYDTDGLVDEANLMAVVFTVAPSKYQSVLSAVQLEKKRQAYIGRLGRRNGSSMASKQCLEEERGKRRTVLNYSGWTEPTEERPYSAIQWRLQLLWQAWP